MTGAPTPIGGARAPIVITGVGLETAAGYGMEPLERSLENGRSHVASLRHVDVSDFPIERGAEMQLDPEPIANAVPRLSRSVLHALEGALAEAETVHHPLPRAPLPRARTGIALGTTLGLIDELARGGNAVPLSEERRRLDVDAALRNLAKQTSLGGASFVFSLACASGLCAVEQAAAEIALGRADAMLVGGADTLGRFMQGGFCSLRGFGPQRRANATSRRVSIVLGEAAAFIVLEPLANAQARGVTRLGVLESQRLVSDGYHLASPDPSGDGMARAISLALDDAGLAPSDVGAVVLTALGSPFHERMLRDVLQRSLGSHAAHVPLTSHELAIGHVLAASSIVGMAYAATLLRDRRVDNAFSVDALGSKRGAASTPMSSTALRGSRVLCLSVGFGGFNGASVLGRSG